MKLTSPALINLPAAFLSKVNPGLDTGFSAALSFSKYCLTRASSWKTGCSRALTPFRRRDAGNVISKDKAVINKSITHRIISILLHM